jgi:hypothetical protein
MFPNEMFSIQMDATRCLIPGSLKVVQGDTEHNGFRVLARGTYAQMMRLQWPVDGEQNSRMETLVNLAMKVGA